MKAKELIQSGEHKSAKISKAIIDMITQEPLAKIDYVEIVDLENLEPVKTVGKNTLIAIAVYIGTTRLIDNIIAEVR